MAVSARVYTIFIIKVDIIFNKKIYNVFIHYIIHLKIYIIYSFYLNTNCQFRSRFLYVCFVFL